MTDDFFLFPDAAGPDAAVDPDIALITAYVARELSLVQIVAVEERLATDYAFRERVAPILQGWALPRSFASNDAERMRSLGAGAPLFTRQELDAGWQRHVDQNRRHRAPDAPVRSPSGRAATRRMRRWSVARIAAVMTMVVLPIAVTAQIVAYAASHPNSPGHDIAQSLLLPLRAIRGSIGGDGERPPQATLTPAPREGQQPVPVRALGAVVATTPVALGSVAQLVTLSDGRVLVSDPARRLLLMFDSSLAHPRTVLDSAMGQANTYSSGIGGGTGTVAGAGGGSGGRGNGAAGPMRVGPNPPYLRAFRGDSVLWWDNTALVFLVITPDGTIARTLAPPPFASLMDPQVAPPMPETSARLGLVYAVTPQRIGGDCDVVAARERLTSRDSSIVVPTIPQNVVRMDFDTRAIDTLGSLANGGVCRIGIGRAQQANVFEPFRFVDDVVTTSDGSIVMLNARAYRLDWVTPDGARTAQKLTYPWRRVPDDVRQFLTDSLDVLPFIDAEGALARYLADSTRLGRVPIAAEPARRPVTRARDTRLSLQRSAPGAGPPGPSVPFTLGDAILGGQVPDFYAPVPPNALRADADGNVWIRQVSAVSGAGVDVWDVVDRTRGVIDRIRIPDTRTIVGFGRGVVYLAAYDAGSVRLEKVRIR